MRILPAPVHFETREDEFSWPECATIGVQTSDLLPLAQYFRTELKRRTQLDSSVTTTDTHKATIQLGIRQIPEACQSRSRGEAYELTVAADRDQRRLPVSSRAVCSTIRGSNGAPWRSTRHDSAYLTHGAPPARGGRAQIQHICRRGTLLDTGRHIFSVDFIKKLLDLMALHKLNKFHWHLTEDQGWRIEIKSLPRLTEVGAYRGENRYGGFYTQDQTRDIVKYAQERYIDVIPEIEMPGHCMAALACYPHLSCTGEVHEVPTQWGVQVDVYCAGALLCHLLLLCLERLREVCAGTAALRVSTMVQGR
jgi:Glycosyl hydrolase family 20, catalytic domain